MDNTSTEFIRAKRYLKIDLVIRVSNNMKANTMKHDLLINTIRKTSRKWNVCAWNNNQMDIAAHNTYVSILDYS